MSDPWRDAVRVDAAKAGVARSRAVLAIRRDGARYFAGDREFQSWTDAIAFVLAQDEVEQNDRRTHA